MPAIPLLSCLIHSGSIIVLFSNKRMIIDSLHAIMHNIILDKYINFRKLILNVLAQADLLGKNWYALVSSDSEAMTHYFCSTNYAYIKSSAVHPSKSILVAWNLLTYLVMV